MFGRLFYESWTQSKVILQIFQCAVSLKAQAISTESWAKNTKYNLNFYKLFKTMYLITESERNEKKEI